MEHVKPTPPGLSCNKFCTWYFLLKFFLFLLGVLTVSIPQSTYTEDYSNTVTLDCVISGTPAATRVYWEATKNGVTTQIEVTNSTKYSGSSISTPSLTITNAISEDEGVYKCFAENVFGLAESNQTTLDIVPGSK